MIRRSFILAETLPGSARARRLMAPVARNRRGVQA
jgi:hypothetical protein